MTPTPRRLPSTVEVVGCLEAAQAELARGTENATWYAARHLEDAARELAALRRLVSKLPQRC